MLAAQMKEMACGECGVEFMVPEWFYKERKNTGKSWSCPNGHTRVFSKSRIKELEQEVEREKEAAAWSRLRMDDEIKSHRATKGHLTRAKKRAAHGVCPCCNRTFKQLAAHMKTKHPDFIKESSGSGK